MPGARRWAAWGAVLYVLWGLLHMGLGASMVVGDVVDGLPSAEVDAESLLYFVCVTVFGAQAIFVAVSMNRVNSPVGFWLNAVVLGVVDLAFLALLVVPGHVDLIGGTAGPVIWLLATVCAATALRREPAHRAASSPRREAPRTLTQASPPRGPLL